MNRFQHAGRKAVLGLSAALMAGGMMAAAPSASAAAPARPAAAPQDARSAGAPAFDPRYQRCVTYRVVVRGARVYDRPARRSGVVDRVRFRDRLRSSDCHRVVTRYNRFERTRYVAVFSFRDRDRVGWVDSRAVRRDARRGRWDDRGRHYGVHRGFTR